MINRQINAILQKYYGAMRSLSEFSVNNFDRDNIYYLETFFVNFRSTYELVENLMVKDNKRKEFEALYNRHFKNYSKTDYPGFNFEWFRRSRNKIIHEESFDILITVNLVLYLNDPVLGFRVENKEITDVSIAQLGDYLLKMKELHADNDTEEVYGSAYIYYNKTKSNEFWSSTSIALEFMSNFLLEVFEIYPLNEEEAKDTWKETNILRNEIEVNKGQLVKDFMLGNTATEGRTLEGPVISDNKHKVHKFEDKTVPISSYRLHGYYGRSTYDFFEFFVTLHKNIFLQEGGLSPVFFIVYKNNKVRVVLFDTDSLSTYYRKLVDIKNKERMQQVKAIFLATPTVSASHSLIDFSSEMSEETLVPTPVLQFEYYDLKDEVRRVVLDTDSHKLYSKKNPVKSGWMKYLDK